MLLAYLGDGLRDIIGGGDEGGIRLAYLDPSSGSFMVQALIAALAGEWVGVAKNWLQTPNAKQPRQAKHLTGLSFLGEREQIRTGDARLASPPAPVTGATRRP